MKKVLELLSSARGKASYSTQLADAVVEKIVEKYPGSTIKKQDLVKETIHHLNENTLTSFFTELATQPEDLQKLSEYSNKAIEDLQNADIIVIGVAFYNFGIPSVLKAYIDHVSRASKTFKYVNGAPVGLLTGKKVYLAISYGGVYSSGDYKALDFAEPYLRTILGFYGLTDITTFRVEGVNVGELKDNALQKGLDSIVID